MISRRNDDMDEITGRESAKLGYGGDSPYARQPEYQTVDAITREDLIDWHQRTVAPNNMMSGIAGDFDSAAIEEKLRDLWARRPKALRCRKPKSRSTSLSREFISWRRMT